MEEIEDHQVTQPGFRSDPQKSSVIARLSSEGLTINLEVPLAGESR